MFARCDLANDFRFIYDSKTKKFYIEFKKFGDMEANPETRILNNEDVKLIKWWFENIEEEERKRLNEKS